MRPMPDFLNTGPADAPCRLLLAHGAGAPMTSPFMETISALLAERGVAVTRFEFSYMAARRDGGKRRPPPKAETLIGEFEAAIAEARALPGSQQRLFIGGKSMGGRVAAMLAGVEDCPQRVRGCVCIGYPLHPPSQPDKLRLAPLLEARRPVLVCQGERDVFGTRAEIETMDWPEHMSWQFLADGSHDLGPTGRSEATLKGNIDRAAKAVRAFMASQPLR